MDGVAANGTIAGETDDIGGGGGAVSSGGFSVGWIGGRE